MNWRNMAAMMVVVMNGTPVLAQSPLSISSTVETGWTSNATDSVGGGSDFYASHSHELALSGQTDTLLLRGSLRLDQTRFVATAFENDDALAGGVEAQLAIGTDAVLRLGYAVTQRWTGDDLSLGNLVIPIRLLETEHEYLAELAVIGPEQQVKATVTADWVLPGASEIGLAGVPPLRLAADIGSVTGRVAWERALSPKLAALVDMEAWFTLIPEPDQVDFLRAPADGMRVATGLRVIEGGLTFEGRGGFDLVWPKGLASIFTRSGPYAAVAASVAPVPDVTLTVKAETGVELADPLDGVAGRTASAELGASWQIRPALVLSGQLAAWREWALFDDLMRARRLASLSARYALSERLSYGTTLSFAQHDEPGGGYDKTTLALSLTGAL